MKFLSNSIKLPISHGDHLDFILTLGALMAQAQKKNSDKNKTLVGEVYIEMGLLTENQRNRVLDYCKAYQCKFLDGVLQMGLVEEKDLVRAFGQDYQKDLVSVKPGDIPLSTQYFFTPQFLITYGVIPLGIKKGKRGQYVQLGMLTPGDLGTVELAGQKLGYPIQSVLVTVNDFLEVLEKVYSAPVEVYVKNNINSIHPFILRHLSRDGKINLKNKIKHTLTISNPESLEEIDASSKPFGSDENNPVGVTHHFRPSPVQKKGKGANLNIPVKTSIQVSGKLEDMNTAERLQIPSALAFRVMPPLMAAPDKEEKKDEIIGDRRTRKRKAPDYEFLLGVKVKKPSHEGKHRIRGEIRQFQIKNFSTKGMFLTGNRMEDVDIGSVYELVFSSYDLKNYNGKATHFTLTGKIVWVERETDQGKESGIGVEILTITPGMKPLWNELAEIMATAA